MNSRVAQLLRYCMVPLAVAVMMSTAVAADQQLSAAVYEKLANAQEAMDQGHYTQALNDLRDLLEQVRGDAYAEAMVLQTMAYAHLYSGDRAAAIDAFAAALERDALPAKPRLQVQQALGRLYAITGQYQKAREVLEDWLAQTRKNPSVEDYVALAQVYAQLKDYDQGIGAIRKAIALSPDVKRSRYQLLVAMQIQSKRYAEAADTLERMVDLWPGDAQLWMRLANTYLYMHKDKKAHVILKLAYQKGLLESGSELLKLAKVGMAVGVPYNAAQVIAKGIQKGRIESNEAHWRLLATAWIRANAYDKAVHALARAADYGNAGMYHLRQAELYMRQNQWAKVLTYVRKALNAGGLESPGRAYLLRGMAHARLGQYSKGLAALHKARRYDKTTVEASSWVQYVQSQQERKTSKPSA